MPVPAPEDRILNPGVRETLLQPDLVSATRFRWT